jgi:hypothetical protein
MTDVPEKSFLQIVLIASIESTLNLGAGHLQHPPEDLLPR